MHNERRSGGYNSSVILWDSTPGQVLSGTDPDTSTGAGAGADNTTEQQPGDHTPTDLAAIHDVLKVSV
jgi:hypothetical protein